jgi:hypothetical protein
MSDVVDTLGRNRPTHALAMQQPGAACSHRLVILGVAC